MLGSPPCPQGTLVMIAGEKRVNRFTPTPVVRVSGFLGCASAVRFTPTGVGNTLWSMTSQKRLTVHAHAYGEHREAMIAAVNGYGSSPRTWGLPLTFALLPAYHRFTPTHVGTTNGQPFYPMPFTVHPHARGDYNASAAIAGTSFGSPPRTWGLPT